MSNDSNSLIDLSGLTEPVTLIVRKICNAIGAYSEPSQIVRIAKAEVEAEKIRAIAHIEITELQQRAIARFATEEGRKQANMESITRQAIPLLEDNTKPENLDDDWITAFFDKCRLISDAEMQQLWARLLAGQANSRRSVSKRTVDLLASLDRSDAELFTTLCSFVWEMDVPTPLIYEVHHEIYTKRGIDFDSLYHLDRIGLITFNDAAKFAAGRLSQHFEPSYFGRKVRLSLPYEFSTFTVGSVLFSKCGMELAGICKPLQINEFFDHIVERWRNAQVLEVTDKLEPGAVK